jgi:hypothetical protein
LEVPSREKQRQRIALFALATLLGLVSIGLGITGTFTFVSCGNISCINIYSLDILAVVLGAVLLFVVGVTLRRTMSNSGA